MLALTSACGRDSGEAAGSSEGSGSSRTSADGTGLAQKELDGLALTARDVDGYTVNAVTGQGEPVTHDDLATYRAVTPAPCRAVYAAAQLGSLQDFTARVSQDIVSTSDDLGQHASVSLTSYAPAHARTVMTELRAALPKCATAEMRPSAANPGAGLGYSDARPGPGSDYGDEALAFDATQFVSSGGPSIPVTVLVVRKGSTIATFTSLNPFQPPIIPVDIIEAQLKKLA
ncbi:hypothetical protein G3I78_26520 [Streptomyces sp. SID13726]|nr:hypothetical protein [Streptomyces sp. SID13726]